MLERKQHEPPVIEKRFNIGLLTEGNSLRATSRLADVSINTVTKLLVDVGAACELYQAETVKNLRPSAPNAMRFGRSSALRKRNVPPSRKGEFGRGDILPGSRLTPIPSSS